MIQIIPAIDVIDGRCVRLTQGDFAQKTIYSADPLEVALRFEAAGLRRLHIVDLDGARDGKPRNLPVLERIASATSLEIDFGGGIKTESDVVAVFSAGAAIVNIGSLAFKEPDTFISWIDKFSSSRLLLGADTKSGVVAIDGWKTATGAPILEYLKQYADRGLTTAFVTDVDRDGLMSGPAVELYRSILLKLDGFSLIASGGVRSISDVDELDDLGCVGVIIGKAFYEGKITLEELRKYAG